MLEKKIDLNKPNQYGIPLHACNGYRHDEHYWTLVRYRNMTGYYPWKKVENNHARKED